MMFYDIVHSPDFEWSAPDYLIKTFLATTAANYITKAAAEYQAEVIQNYPEAQIF
jgi:hypothetical protein